MPPDRCRNHLRLAKGRGPGWEGRRHFFGAAAQAMREIVIEQARRKGSLKLGGGRHRVGLDEVEPAAPRLSDDMLALDEVLTRLAAKDPVKARLVELRYFAGLGMGEAARALGISPATAHRYWNYARAWLHQELTGGPG